MRIFWENREIGSCILTDSGLYKCISCICPMVSREICRLYAVSQSEKLRLGVLQPDGGMLHLDTKIPAKKLPRDFILTLETAEEGFYPVCADAPFSNLSQIMDGRWEKRRGIPGIVIRDGSCRRDHSPWQ